MKKTKTRAEWLDTIPHDVRDRVIANMKAVKGRVITEAMDGRDTSLYKSISGSFPWSGTPEGFDYWENIAKGHATMATTPSKSLSKYDLIAMVREAFRVGPSSWGHQPSHAAEDLVNAYLNC